jgi:hypothetical protein
MVFLDIFSKKLSILEGMKRKESFTEAGRE